MAHARALIPGREAYAPGEVVSDVPGLTRAVEAAIVAARSPDQDPFRAARHALRAKLFDYHDGNAAQRVGELILKQLDAMNLS